MRPGTGREQATARCPLDQALLEKERLDHLFHRIAGFRQGRRDRLDPDRAATVMLGKKPQVAPIRAIEPEVIHAESGQGRIRDLQVDPAIAFHHREIHHAPKEPPGDPRRAPRAPGDLPRAFR